MMRCSSAACAFLALPLSFLCASPVAAAEKKPRSKPAPPAAGPTASDPATSLPAPAPVVVPPTSLPDLLAAIPENGLLGRSELILLALRANPQVWRFHSEAAFFEQAEKAAYDWRDPELRLGYNREFDPDVERPYTERRSISASERELESRRISGFRNEQDAIIPEAGLRGSFNETRRTVTRGSSRQEIVRRIIPGKYRDVIEETVYETENSRISENRNGRDIDSSRDTERSKENRRTRVISRSREVREHPNALYPDESYEITLRIYPPNPWEVRALAAKARAERDVATSRMREEMRDVAMDVNERFDELQFWHLWRRQNELLVDLQQRNLTATEELAKSLGQIQIPGVGSLVDPAEVPRARMEIVKAEEEVFDSLRRLDEVRSELAQLAGVRDMSRIAMSNRLVLRRVDHGGVDIAALVELAKANRPEISEIRARAEVSRAELREVKARRIPWINDVRIGWGRNSLDGYRDQDEFSALLTLDLPLFSWWQNKDHLMHEASIRSLEEARLAMGYSIEGQVEYAVRNLREVSRQLDQHDAHRARLREFAKLNEADAVAAGDKAARIRIATEEEVIKAERGRLQWVHRYNQSVNLLEAAIGMSLQEISRTSGGSK